MATEMERLRGLRNRLWNGIKDIEEVYLNGDLEHGAPNILNVSFNYVEGESLIMALKDLAVSSGSACTFSIAHHNTCLDVEDFTWVNAAPDPHQTVNHAI
eukprot:817872_1